MRNPITRKKARQTCTSEHPVVRKIRLGLFELITFKDGLSWLLFRGEWRGEGLGWWGDSRPVVLWIR